MLLAMSLLSLDILIWTTSSPGILQYLQTHPLPFTASNPTVICLLCCLSFLHETLIVANSMDKVPCWKTASFSARRQIPRIVWNQKFHCLVQNSQINPVHTPSYLFKTLFNIILQSTPGSPKLPYTFNIPHKIPACIFIPLRATCLANLIALTH